MAGYFYILASRRHGTLYAGCTTELEQRIQQHREELIEGFTKLGYDPDLALGLAVVELGCTAIYVFPRTAVLGAILLTAYLGGAVATHVRVGTALFGSRG